MDPITIIVGALVAGAASGIKGVASQAIADTYTSLKRIIQDRYQRAPVEMLENDPNNEARQRILEEDLAKAGAGNDEDLIEQAKALLKAVEEHDPETARDIKVGLRGAKVGADVDIDTLIAEAGGIHIDANHAKVEGSFKIRNLKAGGSSSGKS